MDPRGRCDVRQGEVGVPVIGKQVQRRMACGVRECVTTSPEFRHRGLVGFGHAAHDSGCLSRSLEIRL